MRISSVVLTLVFCASCGPPRFAGTANDESTAGSTETESSSTSSTDSSSTDSSSTDSSSTDSSSTDDGNTASDTLFFVDTGDIIEGNWCEPFAQDCPHGEKCVPYASTGDWWDANKCVLVLGNQAVGEPCISGGIVEATDDCDATSFCWNAQAVDRELAGTCHSFCAGTVDMPECPEGHECLLSSDPVVTLCFPTCDPVAQDCSDELGCYWSGIALICVETLEPPGTLPGQPCGFVNDCEAGSLCVDASVMPDCQGAACCASFCDLGLGDAQCAAVPGTSCVPFWEQETAPAGYDHVGICIVGP